MMTLLCIWLTYLSVGLLHFIGTIVWGVWRIGTSGVRLAMQRIGEGQGRSPRAVFWWTCLYSMLLWPVIAAHRFEKANRQ